LGPHPGNRLSALRLALRRLHSALLAAHSDRWARSPRSGRQAHSERRQQPQISRLVHPRRRHSARLLVGLLTRHSAHPSLREPPRSVRPAALAYSANNRPAHLALPQQLAPPLAAACSVDSSNLVAHLHLAHSARRRHSRRLACLGAVRPARPPARACSGSSSQPRATRLVAAHKQALLLVVGSSVRLHPAEICSAMRLLASHLDSNKQLAHSAACSLASLAASSVVVVPVEAHSALQQRREARRLVHSLPLALNLLA